MAAKKKAVRRKKAAPASVGLTPAEVREASGVEFDRMAERVEADGGVVLGRYSDPFGGTPLLIVGLPVDRVEPTPYQRDPSDAHVKRLMGVIEKIGRFLDPIVAVRDDGQYFTPNGNHRLQALKKLGVKTVVALLVPDPAVAFKILALNTEKAHNLREKALEVARLAEALAALDDRPEREFETEFEEAAFVTLGLCYQVNGRFSGGAYHPILKRCDRFLAAKLPNALATRRERAEKLIELNELVNEAVKAMKSRGLESPYLKAFVVARINPLRFSKSKDPDFDATIDKMIASARRFDSAKIKADQIARTGGPPAAEE